MVKKVEHKEKTVIPFFQHYLTTQTLSATHNIIDNK